MAFWRDVAVVTAVKIVSLVCAALVTVVIVRYLGSAGQGTWAVLTTWAGLAVELGGLGLGAANVYFASRLGSRVDPRNEAWTAERPGGILRRLAGNALIAGFGLGAVAAVLVYAGVGAAAGYTLGTVSRGLLAATLVSVPFAFITNYSQGLYFATGRVRFYGGVEAAAKAAWLGGAFLILAAPGSPRPAGGDDSAVLLELAILFSATTAATALAYAAGLGASFGWRFQVVKRLFAATLRYGFRSYVASLLGALLLRSDILFVNFFRGPSETGHYSVAATFANVLFLVPGAIGMLLFPRVAATGDGEGIFTRKIARFVLVLAVVMGAAAAAAAPFVFRLLFAGRAAGALAPFWLLLPGTVAYALQTVYYAFFAGRNLPPVVFVAPATGLVLNVGLNLLVVPAYGAAGAAVSSSLAYVAALVVLIREFTAATGSLARREAKVNGVSVVSEVSRADGAEDTVFRSYESLAPWFIEEGNRTNWGYIATKALSDWALLSRIDLAGRRVLNIGCSEPIDELWLVRKAGEWVAVDYSPRSIDAARTILENELATPLRERVSLVTADARSLPFEAESFDVVLAFSTIEHIPGGADREKVLREVKRVLRPGGHFIITVPNRWNLSYRLWSTRRQRSGLAEFGYECFYSPIELRRLLVKSGFRPLKFASELRLIGVARFSPLLLFTRFVTQYFGARIGYLARLER